jgi:hypothetical protein
MVFMLNSLLPIFEKLLLPLIIALIALIIVKILSDKNEGKIAFKGLSIKLDLPFGYVGQWLMVYGALYYSVINLGITS